MYKCENIHMGDRIKVYGPIYINQVITNTIQQSATNYVFLNEVAKKPEYEILNIIKRETWSVRAPRELYQFQQNPAKYVIILDTQTPSSPTGQDNIRYIQTLQKMHVDDKKWSDIAYNFLIGCDGNVYEGRGWGIIGSHTMTYNTRSIGIAFIGSFNATLPTQLALNQAKALIQYGIEIGVIGKDYKLFGHRQIRNSIFPGQSLFNDIKSWDHWCETIPY